MTGRCPSLSLTTTTIRLRYCDDEGSYVNINYGDEKRYREMWNNAIAFDDRDYKRLKVKAGELNSPYAFAPSGLRVQTDIKGIDNVNANMRTSAVYEAKSRKQLDMSYPENEFLTPVERLFKKRDDDIKNTRDNIQSKKAELQSIDDTIERAKRQIWATE